MQHECTKYGQSRAYIMEKFPPIVILQSKTWINSPWLFHVLLLLIKIMENKPKFKPNPKLRLMYQVRQVPRANTIRIGQNKPARANPNTVCLKTSFN